MFKQQLTTARDRERPKMQNNLLKANATWKEEHKDAAKNDIRRTVDSAGQSNPELKMEMIYSWERSLIED